MLQTQELKLQEKAQKQLLIQSSNKMITQEELKKLFHYNPETGIFTRLVSVGLKVKSGQVAGGLDNGYIKIGINGKRYFAHRLAWLYVYGEFSNLPQMVIDHIDGNTINNKIENLRKVTHQQNILNQKLRTTNTSGIKNICWHKREGKWYVRVMNKGVMKNIGYFEDLELAELAAIEARRKYHGQFARD
jgi:hypothetical protein